MTGKSNCRCSGGGLANGHLGDDQRKLLADLESSIQRPARVKSAAAKGKGGKAKPVRHQLQRTPTPTKQARWEAVQKAKNQGLSLRANSRKVGMSRVATTKYANAESPSTKRLSAKERVKAEALAESQTAAD